MKTTMVEERLARAETLMKQARKDLMYLNGAWIRTLRLIDAYFNNEEVR